MQLREHGRVDLVSFDLGMAIALTCNRLAITARRANGRNRRTIVAVLTVASITTSSSDRNLRPNAITASRVRSTRPSLLRGPFSEIATTAIERCTSNPIARQAASLRPRIKVWEPAGNTTLTDSRSQRNRVGRRGGQITT